MDENNIIKYDVDLEYYKHKLEYLVAQDVAQAFSLDNALTIIALLFSMGAMVIAFIQNHKIDENAVTICGKSPAFIAVTTVLVAVLGYAIYAQYKHCRNKRELPNLIEKTKNTIKMLKEERLEK